MQLPLDVEKDRTPLDIISWTCFWGMKLIILSFFSKRCYSLNTAKRFSFKMALPCYERLLMKSWIYLHEPADL